LSRQRCEDSLIIARSPPLGIRNGSMLINQADEAGMADLRGAGQGRLAPHRQVTEAPQKELVIKVRELDAVRMPWTAPQVIRQHTPPR
jgi:hypothetical protein